MASIVGDGPLRRVLLALTLLTAAGLLAELLLLEHFESWTQWIPLTLLVAAIVAAGAMLVRPGRRTVRVFQGLMTLCVLAGALGVYLHYSGNVEFERERDGALRGLHLLWQAIRGATPTLAPGALAQLGLLGLVCTYHHPALRRSTTQPQEMS